jgi:hypothetical protein
MFRRNRTPPPLTKSTGPEEYGRSVERGPCSSHTGTNLSIRARASSRRSLHLPDVRQPLAQRRSVAKVSSGRNRIADLSRRKEPATQSRKGTRAGVRPCWPAISHPAVTPESLWRGTHSTRGAASRGWVPLPVDGERTRERTVGCQFRARACPSRPRVYRPLADGYIVCTSPAPFSTGRGRR